MHYTVLVAEDEELLLHNLVQKIEKADPDFTVIGQAQTGQQAYELAVSLCPDLIITDIRMPVMDGITFLQKIRSLNDSMRFIILSGYSDFAYTKTAISLKVTEYLLKPVDPEELSDALHKAKRELAKIYKTDEDRLLSDLDRDSIHCSQAELANWLKEYLNANYTKDSSLLEAAAKLHYSTGYLTKIFRQAFDCTPSKYMTTLRIMRASQMLLHNPELSICQIGETLGYHDQAYFSRIFKKYTGKSPIEFKKDGT